jgi:hypothetical protein
MAPCRRGTVSGGNEELAPSYRARADELESAAARLAGRWPFSCPGRSGHSYRPSRGTTTGGLCGDQ